MSGVFVSIGPAGMFVVVVGRVSSTTGIRAGGGSSTRRRNGVFMASVGDETRRGVERWSTYTKRSGEDRTAVGCERSGSSRPASSSCSGEEETFFPSGSSVRMGDRSSITIIATSADDDGFFFPSPSLVGFVSVVMGRRWVGGEALVHSSGTRPPVAGGGPPMGEGSLVESTRGLSLSFSFSFTSFSAPISFSISLTESNDGGEAVDHHGRCFPSGVLSFSAIAPEEMKEEPSIDFSSVSRPVSVNGLLVRRNG